MATVIKNAQPGYDIVATTAFELLGIGLLALLAGAGEQIGKIVVIVMIGFLIIWGLSNTDVLQKFFGKPTGIDPIYKKFTG
jgi:hypothetical protein